MEKSSPSSVSDGSRDLQCVGRLEVVKPKPVGFLCGSIPVPTDKAFHAFNSTIIPSSKTVRAPRYRMIPTETDLNKATPGKSSKNFADTLQRVGVKAESVLYERKTHTDLFLQGFSAVHIKAMQPSCSNAVSSSSVISSKIDPITIPVRQAHSNPTHSFSGQTSETSMGDCQDCGVSSNFPMGEPPRCPPCPETFLPSSSRDTAVLRYKEKRKARHVRYACSSYKGLVAPSQPLHPHLPRPLTTSIVFTLEEGPGVLFKALAVFALREINLAKVF